MFALFLSLELTGMVLFGISLVALSVSLIYSLWEIQISTNALNVQLQDVEAQLRASGKHLGGDA